MSDEVRHREALGQSKGNRHWQEFTYIYICICINMYVYVYLDMLMNVNNVESCVHIYILYLVLESIVELLKTLMCS